MAAEFSIDQRVRAEADGAFVEGVIKGLRGREKQIEVEDEHGSKSTQVVEEPIARVRTDDGLLLVIPLDQLVAVKAGDSEVEDASEEPEGQGASEESNAE